MGVLRLLVGGLLVATAVHYTDNWLSIEDYAPREGFVADNPGVLVAVWLGFAVFGVLGYRELRGSPSVRASLLLAVFSASGLITLTHLRFEGNDWSAWQWASVVIDGVLGLALLITAFAWLRAARV